MEEEKKGRNIKERIWKFLHPMSKIASEFKKSFEKADIEKLLEEGKGIYLMNVGSPEEGYRLIRTKPRVIILHPEFMKAMLKELGSSDERHIKSAIAKLESIAKRGEKAVIMLPLQHLYLKAAWNVYKRLKNELGDRLKSFAVTGSILTGNVEGVPVKVQKVQDIQTGEVKNVVHLGVLDDLDLVVVVEGLKDEEREKIRRIIEEEIEKSGLPSTNPASLQEGILDDSRPFILDQSDIRNLAHYFHKEKPILFFDQKHMEWASKLLNNEEFRRLAEREAEEYRKKKQFYREKVDEYLEKVFKDELKRIEKGEKPSKEIQAISENLPLFLHLFQSGYFRDNIDRLIGEYIKEAKKEGIPPSEANEKLRRALAAVIKRYMEASANIYKTAHSGKLLERFQIYKKVKEFYKNALKRTRSNP